ncbi:MAG TPA: universal stress protein [Planctomycetes bacterium]|nr:universal stress protein [Planctomycetota bacterium]
MPRNTDFYFEMSRDVSQSAPEFGATGPVMLALSTFKDSVETIEAAIEKARRCKKLVIVFGHQVNMWLYFLETDIGFFPRWKEECEKKLLVDIHQQQEEKAEAIANRARAENIQVTTYVRTERFRAVCMEVAKKERPSLIILKKNVGPAWFRRFFGSLVGYPAPQAGCSVLEV